MNEPLPEETSPSDFTPANPTPTDDTQAESTRNLLHLHLQFGWWSLLVFLTLGLVLESLHGFKSGWFLNVSSETRRLMWRLAHAHGTLLALVHIAFAVTVPLIPQWGIASRRLSSRCLISAGVLMPVGFFLGGVVVHGGDPSLGILLVPVGAALLAVSVFLVALATTKSRT